MCETLSRRPQRFLREARRGYAPPAPHSGAQSSLQIPAPLPPAPRGPPLSVSAGGDGCCALQSAVVHSHGTYHPLAHAVWGPSGQGTLSAGRYPPSSHCPAPKGPVFPERRARSVSGTNDALRAFYPEEGKQAVFTRRERQMPIIVGMPLDVVGQFATWDSECYLWQERGRGQT